MILPFTLLPALILAQDKSIPGSIEASQAAAKSLVFIISAPQNCLKAVADLPNSVSKNMAALWIRAAFHDAGTWSPNTANPGGLDASILSFLNATENAGLTDSMANNFVRDGSVNMTRADRIALGAHVSVTHCGGPSMLFRPGRRDAVNATSPIGLIPPGNARLSEVRSHFARMGWTNEDIVALVTGSHTMGGVHAKNSPTVTNKTFIPFDDTAGIFDNHVFKFTLQGKCAIPLDCDIANDPELRPIVQKYADNQDAFFAQYKISFQKLLGQTTSPLGTEQSLDIPLHVGLKETEQPPLNFDGTPSAVESPKPKTTSDAGRISVSIFIAYGLASLAFI